MAVPEGSLGSRTIRLLTHHKCASAWLAGYVEAVRQLNGWTRFATGLSHELPQGEAPDLAVFGNAAYPFLARHGAAGLHIIRNPLDLVVSAYHSHRDTHPIAGWPALATQRQVLHRVGPAEGMMLTIAFLERADFYDGAVGPLHALRHWDFADGRFVSLRMEDMVRDPDATIGAWLGAQRPGLRLPRAEQHSFAAVAGRPAGTIDPASHYRSGRPGQWRDSLPPAAIHYLQASLEPLLRRFYPESL